MRNYLNLLKDVSIYGEWKDNRTGIRTKSSFGHVLKFDLADGFPIVTTKKIHWKSVVHELLWFIKGETNIRYLQNNGVRIWNEWADEHGDLGPVYGAMWRGFPSYREEKHNIVHENVDQLQNVIERLRTNPNDRRLVVSSWNPGLLPLDGYSFAENVERGRQALPPCHFAFQFVKTGENDLNLVWHQRSVDLFLGLPFNISSYALLLSMVAHVVDMRPRQLMFTGADCHIYENHLEQVEEQLQRNPYPLPKLELNPNVKEIDEFTEVDIDLINYQHHSVLKGKVAV